MGWVVAACVVLALLVVVSRADRRNNSKARMPDDLTEPERRGPATPYLR